MSVDEIVARGFRRKKPNKIVAFTALRGVISAVENGDRVNLEDLELLAAFFKPSIPKKPKTVEQWVATAVNPFDTRPALRYVYYDASAHSLVGTDLHILFVASGVDHGAGDVYFDPATFTPVDCAALYPDYKNLVLNVELRDAGAGRAVLDDTAIEVLECKQIASDNKVKSLRKIGRRWFDETYLRKAVAFGPMVVAGIADSDALHLKSEDGARTAIIMSIRA